MHDFHLVDATVATDTANTVIDMGRMVEEHEVWLVMNFQPGDWFTGRIAFADQFQCVCIRLDARMAVHADLRVRDRRKRCGLDG